MNILAWLFATICVMAVVLVWIDVKLSRRAHQRLDHLEALLRELGILDEEEVTSDHSSHR